MKEKGPFDDSGMANLLFKSMSLVMENPLRRRFNDPVKALKAAGIRLGLEVLEVGCGTGFFTIPAAELVGDEGRVHAIDLHPLAIEQVTKKIQDTGLRNFRLTKTDALETGLPSDSFDLVILFGVIPSPSLPSSLLLPEMHRLLKPDGTMAVWTGFPFWSPVSITKGGLFTYVGKRRGVHIFRRGGKEKYAKQDSYSHIRERRASIDRFARSVWRDRSCQGKPS